MQRSRLLKREVALGEGNCEHRKGAWRKNEGTTQEKAGGIACVFKFEHSVQCVIGVCLIIRVLGIRRKKDSS